MRLHGFTWAVVVTCVFVLLTVNLLCWRPGIGVRPEGTEVELYYGWPATYRADWWRSTNRSLGPVCLASALHSHTTDGLELRARYADLWPALADVGFGIAVL